MEIGGQISQMLGVVMRSRQSGAAVLDGSRLEDADDNILAAELAQGRHDALVVLFTRHSAVVLRTARRILGSHSEAEEVVQQVFIEAYHHISQFDPERGTFRTWLLRRTVSRAINRKQHLRGVHHHDSQEIDGDVELELYRKREIGLGMGDQEISYLANELLKKLPIRERRVIKAMFFEGMTTEEITQRVGESLPAVRRLFYEGLRRLRSMLKEGPDKSRKLRE